MPAGPGWRRGSRSRGHPRSEAVQGPCQNTSFRTSSGRSIRRLRSAGLALRHRWARDDSTMKRNRFVSSTHYAGLQTATQTLFGRPGSHGGSGVSGAAPARSPPACDAPVSSSRSTSSERSCPSTTAADSVSGSLASPVASAIVDEPLLQRLRRLVGGQPVGHLIGRVGDLVEHEQVVRRHRLVEPGTDHDPPDQHPGVAQRPVERADQLRDRADMLLGATAGTATTGPPPGPRRPRPAARPASASVSRARFSASRRPATSTSRAASRVERSSRASSRTTLAASSRGRRSGAPGTMVAATSATAPPIRASTIRLTPAVDGQQGRHHDRLHRRLVDEQHAGVEQDRSRHRHRDDDGDLPAAAAEQVGEQVGDADADRAADADLGDPAEPLAVRRAEAEHRRDRREERRACGRTTAVAITQATAAAIAHWPIIQAFALQASQSRAAATAGRAPRRSR